MLVENRKIESLVPYPNNARTHSKSQINQVAESIKEFGFTNPVLIDDDSGIIAGHARVQAAKQLGKTEVPTIKLSHLNETQKKAYILADNRIAENAGWDKDLLKIELQSLAELGFDLNLTGFDEKELNLFLASVKTGLIDENESPEIDDKVITKQGDIWLMDNHRIICGDATQQEVSDKLFNGVKPNLMVTDPPYGVDYKPGWRNRLNSGTTDNYISDDKEFLFEDVYKNFPGNIIYLWHANLHSHNIANCLIGNGFDIRAVIIWAKQHFAISQGFYHWQHEPCFYAIRKGKQHDWSGDRKQTTLWNIASLNSFGKNKDEDSMNHSCQKPIECMRKPIENNSSSGQAVYDPFLGSGTTLIAAEQTGRTCYGIELEPKFVDMAVKRWQNFTGKQAKRESDQLIFNNISPI